MRVGYDIGPIAHAPTGVGNFAYQLLKHLLDIEADVSLTGFSASAHTPWLRELAGRIPYRRIPVPARVMYRLWDMFPRPAVDSFLGGVDVYHATNYYLPPCKHARTVLTIYDLAFLARPELASPKIVGPFSRLVRRFARRADAVVACSEQTKKDIVRLLDVPEDRVSVVYGAVDDSVAAVEPSEARDRLREQYGIDSPYILFVGTLEPRKNIPTLVEAFAKLAKELPHQLVLVGGLGWNTEPILRAIETGGCRDRIVRPGYVPAEDLPLFYSGADVLALPSHYEGFGLPLLEAMTCGCPVVAANNSSIPEVVGDAALMHDADDAAGLANALRRVLTEDSLADALRERGRARALEFTWLRAAEQTMDVYRRVAG
ncbi:MAG: glycosyltransferase family 4 protein [bacterium]|nr:glycosyltransferase family 4 protein [bacterium]